MYLLAHPGPPTEYFEISDSRMKTRLETFYAAPPNIQVGVKNQLES